MLRATVRALRAMATIALVVLVVGGLPGSPVRDVVRDLVAPPVPDDVRDRDGAVDVVVADGAAGPPLAGATLRAFSLLDGRAYLAGTASTDAGGSAHLLHLPRGETWLLVDAPGHARASTQLVLDRERRSLRIELMPEHAFDVVVRDDGGATVPAVEIEVTQPGDRLPVGARGDRDGAAHIGRLSPGPWRVTARAAGYEDDAARVARDGEVVRLTLRKLGGLDVQVHDEGDHPVVGAQVVVAGATLWPPRSTTTGDGGDALVGALAAGSYALRATQGERVSPIELGVQLARGEKKTVVLHVGPGRFVSVRVTDGSADDADPVPGARVSLAEGGLSPFPFEGTTDARGLARLGPMAPGSATVAARADGFVPRGAVPVAAPPAETRVALVHAGAIVGRIVDARGYPVDGATIEIAGTDVAGAPIYDDPRRSTFQRASFDAMLGGPAAMIPAGELGVVPGPVPPIPREGGHGAAPLLPGAVASLAEPWVSRDDGTFRAAPASPGRVRVVVHHPQYVEAQSDVVDLAPGGEAHVDVVMHAGGTLEGRVLDAHDRPVAGARVAVSATHGSLERNTHTSSDGTFAFAAMPDEVVVTASVDDDDTQPDGRMVVAVPEGDRKEIVLHLPEARDPLSVTVTDPRGRSVEAAQVSASSLAVDVPLRTTTFTDRDGAAALKRARGLRLRVEVTAPGFAPRVVTSDGSESELKIELALASAAQGEVVASRGRDAIAGAEVTLTTDLGVRRVRTDATGSYTLSGLAPGPARLHVRAPGYAPADRDVLVPDGGGSRPLEIPRVELGEEGAVEGTVVDGRGNPVAGARVARDRVPTWLAVGSTPPGMAVTDAKGRFALHELPEGPITLEAYAPDVGRARQSAIKVVSGRTTVDVTITLAPDSTDGASSRDPASGGSVAVTLGETGAPVDVVVVSVAEGSEAERAGLAAGDVLASVDGVAVHSIAEARTRLDGPVADDVVLAVRRGEQPLTLRVTREAVRR